MSTEQAQPTRAPMVSKVIIAILIAGASYVAWERLRPVPVECDINGFIIDDSDTEYRAENAALIAERSYAAIGSRPADRASLDRAPSCERTVLDRRNPRLSTH